jgi:hypothetical protein
MDAEAPLRPMPGLLLEDVLWLMERCPEGRRICWTVNEGFLDVVDPDEPVVVVRVHAEPLPHAAPSGLPYAVVMGVFATRLGGPPLLNEFACRPDDLAVAMKQLGVPAPTAEQRDDRRRRFDALRREREAEWNPAEQSVWERDEAAWARLLGGTTTTIDDERDE